MPVIETTKISAPKMSFGRMVKREEVKNGRRVV